MGRGETDCSVGGDAAVESAAVPQAIEVGDRFAHRKKTLLQIELAPEQHRHEIGGGERARGADHGRGKLVEPRDVMRAQLRDAHGDPTERQAMRWQHERLGRQRLESGDRREKAAERVAIGLGRPHAHVGADLRQQHVARDQHASLRRKE